MARKLPNVYTEINDLSALIEGNDSLTVGITLRANRGPLNQAVNISDSSDFLARYTFTGKPSVKQDSTYFDIIELLKVSKSVYVSRAANNPLYGGLVIKAEAKIGDLTGVAENNHARILLNGDVVDKVVKNKYIRIATGTKSYRYVVKAVEFATPMTQIELTEKVADALIEELAEQKASAKAIAIARATAQGLTEEEIAKAGNDAEMAVTFDVIYCVEPVKLDAIELPNKLVGAEDKANADKGYKGAFFFETNVVPYFCNGDRFRLEGCLKATGVTGATEDTQFYTVVNAEYDQKTTLTKVYVKEKIDGQYTALPTGEDPKYTNAGVKVFREAIANPELFTFEKDDLCLITGIDQGAYNKDIGIAIESGNEVNFDEGKGLFRLLVHNMLTGTDLEEHLVSMSPEAKSIDGSNVFVSDVVRDGSRYIKVITPDVETLETENVPVPASTPQRELDLFVNLGGGYDGDDITIANNIEALEVFADKMIPVSLLVNGNNENVLYQSAMIAVCEDRMDCFAFLRTPRTYEKLTVPTERVRQLINYKKNTLKSTSYFATMYGPHITTYDNYNARNVVVGADSISCRQWLKTINEKGFPYAAAGPANGTIPNVTTDWKIGDESGEAGQFNDASMNMLVYDARKGTYYFNTQNTLQLANSAFRNVGAVLNILNMKENLTTRLKDYVQLPITDDLQEAVTRTIETYMDGCKSAGRVSNYAINNNTTKIDISNNELHFVLTICPAYYAQVIYLAVNVVNAAFDFQILQSL